MVSPDSDAFDSPQNSLGKVYLVGAGPGHPGLITIRGAECLAKADSILYDYLANPLVLSHTSVGAELICLGRHQRADVWSQAKINAELVRRAKLGEKVVRLKGGDPMVFGRIAEEMKDLVAAQIPFEIVPGITTASAAGAYAGLAITDRRHASAVALVTGHERLGKPNSALDYKALADFPGTLVVYMGVRTVGSWSQALLDAGKPADTPVMLVRRASWPDQARIATTLENVAQALTPYQKFPPPVVAIIGESAKANPDFDWFGQLPLLGVRVLVTRPAHQAGPMISQFSELGASTLLSPSILISEPEDWEPVDQAISDLEKYHYVVFSSTNGVKFFMRRLFALGFDTRRLARAKVAVIGPRTAQSLQEFGLRADIQPETYRAEALATSLQEHVDGKRILLLRASRGREVLSAELTRFGAQVDQVVTYQSTDDTRRDPDIESRWSELDWVTVTSSAIARSLHHQWGDKLKEVKLASISPITTKTLMELGLAPTAEAADYTVEGVVAAIHKYAIDEC